MLVQQSARRFMGEPMFPGRRLGTNPGHAPEPQKLEVGPLGPGPPEQPWIHEKNGETEKCIFLQPPHPQPWGRVSKPGKAPRSSQSLG